MSCALAFLLEERRTWLAGASAPRIERLYHSCQPALGGAADPGRDVTWFCHPEPDSAAVFAQLLGGPQAGTSPSSRTAGPAAVAALHRQHMTVETRWAKLQVVDYLPHDVAATRTDLTRVITGDAKAVVTFAPRPEFGQVR